MKTISTHVKTVSAEAAMNGAVGNCMTPAQTVDALIQKILAMDEETAERLLPIAQKILGASSNLSQVEGAGRITGKLAEVG